jgi:hypothetical protein
MIDDLASFLKLFKIDSSYPILRELFIDLLDFLVLTEGDID